MMAPVISLFAIIGVAMVGGFVLGIFVPPGEGDYGNFETTLAEREAFHHRNEVETHSPTAYCCTSSKHLLILSSLGKSRNVDKYNIYIIYIIKTFSCYPGARFYPGVRFV